MGPRPQNGARDGRHAHQRGVTPGHVPGLSVRGSGRDRREQDGRERGRHRLLGPVSRAGHEQRDDQDPAADAEQPGEEPGHKSDAHEGQGPL
jgi:hypothetical protein